MKSRTKLSARSEVSVRTVKSLQSAPIPASESVSAHLDAIVVKIRNMKTNDDVGDVYNLNVLFYEQLIIRANIVTVDKDHADDGKASVVGTMLYDPADHEKISVMVDHPLSVIAKPVKKEMQGSSLGNESFTAPRNQKSAVSTVSRKSITSSLSDVSKNSMDTLCCNIDILPIFFGQDELHLTKRMEPLVDPPLLLRKSWDNLPLLRIDIYAKRDPQNSHHHKDLNKANYMKMRFIGAYNLEMPYDEKFQYKAVTHMLVHNEKHHETFTFERGYKAQNKLDSLSMFAGWESSRLSGMFAKSDEKFSCHLEDITNDHGIDLENLLTSQSANSCIWGSFHRTLFYGNDVKYFSECIRNHKWPLEVHISSDAGGFSFMAPLNLFHLLYPGEKRVRLAVPLHWLVPDNAVEICGFPPLWPPIENTPSIVKYPRAQGRVMGSGDGSCGDGHEVGVNVTGSGAQDAFILVEVALLKPLKQSVIPPYIPDSEINSMLEEFQKGPAERECTGRGFYKDWETTIYQAASSLRRVPYYGMAEICAFNRQLSETRTRVEMATSFWKEAAKYVNENFVLADYITSENTYKELLLMSHACLMKEVEAVFQIESVPELNPLLRAARHARQLQDMKHARHLYMQLLIDQPNDENVWRELATCIKDLDDECAFVCMYKSIELNSRHPLSLLSMGCMVADYYPDEAEPFFEALLAMYPFYTSLWYACYCFYIKKEMFEMAATIMELILKTKADGDAKEMPFPRAWEHELGDWWEQTPILPGMSGFYDAADLLLRLRALMLADVSISQAVLDGNETAPYFHMLALCCRLRGDVSEALCHVRLGREKFGEVLYLITLEAECLFKLGELNSSMAAFVKAGNCICPYSILLSTPCREHPKSRSVLVDLLRRQPSAYGWIALANDWMQRLSNGEREVGDQLATTTCAAACTVQALRIDRTFARAWALLAKLVTTTDRRVYCRRMAAINGYRWQDDYYRTSDLTACYIRSKALLECRCYLNSCECPTHK